MNRSLGIKTLSFCFAAMVTLSIMASLDALATTGQSSSALLAQKGTLQTACVDPSRSSSQI